MRRLVGESVNCLVNMLGVSQFLALVSRFLLLKNIFSKPQRVIVDEYLNPYKYYSAEYFTVLRGKENDYLVKQCLHFALLVAMRPFRYLCNLKMKHAEATVSHLSGDEVHLLVPYYILSRK